MRRSFKALYLLFATVFGAMALCGCGIINIPGLGNTSTTPTTTETILFLVASNPLTVAVGEKKTLVAVTDGEETEAEWGSSDYSIVDVLDGVIEGIAPGTAEIYVVVDDAEASIEVTVTEGDGTYTVSAASTMTHGTVVFSAQKAAPGTSVTVTPVPEEGYRLSSLAVNGTDITQTRTFIMPAANVTVYATFTQIPSPEQISLTQTNIKITVGQTLVLKATTASGNTVKWSTSDASVATVSNGTVLAKKKGEATITVTCNDSSASVKVTVLMPSDDPELIKDGYTLTWHDEFDGNTLDSANWNYQLGVNDVYGSATGPWAWGNDELQFYTSESKNVNVSGGCLNITAIKEPKPDGRTYSSARILTRDKFSQTYGYFEARMKTPTGEGLWPAFWMLPQPSSSNSLNNVYGGWPHSGEIDIMEAKGRLQNVVDMTLHFAIPGSGGHNYVGNNYTMGTNTDQWHTYAVDWTADYIRWYIDGVQRCQATSSMYTTDSSSAASAPFDKPFYIIFNLAVGGQYDSLREPPNGFVQATMQVDYIRVWQHNR